MTRRTFATNRTAQISRTCANPTCGGRARPWPSVYCSTQCQRAARNDRRKQR